MQEIFQEELVLAAAPTLPGDIGALLLAPVLVIHGSEWQKAQYLDGALSGEILFCQGFSEPDAGSDLASLRTRAEHKAGHWVINGQKVWSSLAHTADRCFLLARTDPDPASRHRGLGFFLLNLRQDGVEVRPIRQMTGDGEFCEIFLRDAIVEDRDLVGEPGDGWGIAMTTFGFERGSLAVATRSIGKAVGLAALSQRVNRSADPMVRQRVAQAYIEASIFRMLSLRSLATSQQGRPPGPEASLTKLYMSELDRRLHETAVNLQGMSGNLAPAVSNAVHP
jgi:alkylation response protein AidB-like acyl-CoA dehydrogenase